MAFGEDRVTTLMTRKQNLDGFLYRLPNEHLVLSAYIEYVLSMFEQLHFVLL